MGPIRSPETSVRNQPTLRSIQKHDRIRVDKQYVQGGDKQQFKGDDKQNFNDNEHSKRGDKQYSNEGDKQ